MFLYIILFMVAFQGSGNFQVTPIIVAVSYMFLMTSCAWEDKNDSDVLLNSIPIPRWKIVAAKYVSVIAYGAAAALGYWLVKTIISVAGFPLKVSPIVWEGVLGGLLGIGLVSALYLPLFFKLGYLRSKSMNFVIFFGFFALIGFLPKLLPTKPEWIAALESAEYSITPIAFLAAIVVLLQRLSYLLSLRFYTRREF